MNDVDTAPPRWVPVVVALLAGAVLGTASVLALGAAFTPTPPVGSAAPAVLEYGRR